jgi:uroporphyrinogen III methyltransferase/synthase
VASIGPITSDTARAAGLTVGIEAEEYTIPGLVTAVAKHFGVDIDEED